MLGTLVAVQAGQSLSTDGVGRDHALDSVGHSQIAVLSHQLAVLDLLQAADELAVGDVELLLGLLAGQNSLVAVDDDNVIAAIDVGGVVDLLLATQQNSGLSSDVTQTLAGCVEQIPLALDFSGLYESSVLTVQAPFGSASVSIPHKNAPVNRIFRFFQCRFSVLSKPLVFS